MEPWSTYLSMAARRFTKSPIQGRSRWPARKGTSNCSMMWPMAASGSPPAAWRCSSRPTSSGVMKMPIKVEAEALQMAAGMLPRATAVKAMADCTVAGKAHRNSTPRYRSGVTSGCNSGRRAQPSSGNSTKVLATTTRCRRQWLMPASTASRESLAPCRKNSRLTAATVSHSKPWATWPEAGSTLASTTGPRWAIKPQADSKVKCISLMDLLFDLMNVTLRQLEVFRSVALTRNFSRSGQLIGLTQPAVSRCITELEAQLGLKLLNRTTREVELTEAGRKLAARLERVLEELDNTLLDVQGMATERRGRVRVASSPTLSANLMPECIALCRRQWPGLQLTLLDRIQHDVLDSVRSGEVDFGVVIDPGEREDLHCEPILSEPFCLVCPPGHALAQQAQAHWRDLAGESLVLLDHD